MKTITIAGGGLAGLALGVGLARRGVPVVVHEAMKYPRHRVCGEFMAGLHHDSLASLGVTECLADAAQHTQTAWFDTTGCWGDFSLPEPAYALSRYELDHRLMSLFVQHGGKLHENSRYLIKATEEGLVVASGRQRPNQSGRGDWLGLKMHVRGLALRQPLEMHLGAGAYVGLAAVEDGWINVSGLFRCQSGFSTKREQLLMTYLEKNGLTELAGRLRQAMWREDSFSAVSGLIWGSRPQALWAVGDAVQIIPPFTGHGMSMALRSAALALDPLEHYARGKKSWAAAREAYQQSLHREMRGRLRCAYWLQRMLLAPAFRPIMRWLAHRRRLPFHTFYRLTHA